MDIFSLKNFKVLLNKLDKKSIKLIHILNNISIFTGILSIFFIYIHYTLYVSHYLIQISASLFETGIIICISAYLSAILVLKLNGKIDT